MSSITEQLSSYGKSTGPRAKGFRLGATIDTSRLSQLGCGGKCCKLALMALSIFLVLAGIGILAGGAYATNNLDVIAAIGPDFTNAIIAFGVLLIVIGALGLAGAMNESRAILACVSRERAQDVGRCALALKSHPSHLVARCLSLRLL
jgi:hypothetical protein